LVVEKLRGDIKFKEVDFEYNKGVPVLKKLSFEVKAGQSLAIVGNTGSGKTSIISTLSSLYPIQSGKIEIDGINIDQYDLSFLRSRMGTVLQDVFLFYGSIYDNISLKNDTISKSEIIEASKAIGAHDFIMNLPDGYEYIVSERGNNLSMGQRQLISFVRAWVYNPDILILDEATSSIDTHTEQIIQAAISRLIKGRTSIIIAHRLSTVRQADQILVLSNGEIKEKGTHEELLSQIDGLYYQLNQAQIQLAEF